MEQSIVDAEHYDAASRQKATKKYAAKLWLIEPEGTVKYREILQEQDSSVGGLPTPKLSFQKSAFRGKALFKKEMGVGIGFKKPADPSSLGKVYQYDFDVTKIRGPVKELVEANSWRFEQVILDYQLTRGQDQCFCVRCGAALTSGALFCINCGKKIA